MKQFIIAGLFALCLLVVPVLGQAKTASWYGPGFHGHLTSSGEVFNMYALTAAHKTYKMGTRLRVTNLRNGRSVIVRINDRGPFVKGRDLDLSKAANARINCGVCKIKIQVLSIPKHKLKYKESYHYQDIKRRTFVSPDEESPTFLASTRTLTRTL